MQNKMNPFIFYAEVPPVFASSAKIDNLSQKKIINSHVLFNLAQEEEAMLYIWELGSCFVKDIVAKYPKPAPPYTTVASIVKNLERKQYIRAARVGNTYQYTPLIRESEYKRTFMSGFVRNYFENSYKEMVSFFAKDQKISANDLKDIIDMIEKGKE